MKYFLKTKYYQHTMAKVLGLDLGSGSIGWAVVNYSNNREELHIDDIGVRVVPIDSDSLNKFNTGEEITINSARTARRTARKTFDRYCLRKTLLLDFFAKHSISISHQLMSLNRDELWQLRANAVTEKLSLEQIARVLYMINQKRGYKATKADLDPENKKQSKFINDVRDCYMLLYNSGKTIGQWASDEFKKDREFRVKDNVFPRAAYIEEFDAIIEKQRSFYPKIFTPENIKYLRDNVIFYQRPLKSCKHLVSNCEFAQLEIEKPDGRKMTVGPKVAQKSNPLFQLSRIWQAVNNISANNRLNEKLQLDLYQKEALVQYLLSNKTLTTRDFNKIIFQKTNQNVWFVGKALGRGIPGDRTRLTIAKALNGKYQKLLEFNVPIKETVDEETGETVLVVDPSVVNQDYYQLWHCIYSIPDKENLMATLRKRFGIEDEQVLENLSNIDFVKDGYGNMSIKAIRKILPYLMKGEMYSDACLLAGFRHSESLTKEENANRPLNTHLEQIQKGDLRQPIVEKILNQMVNLVNALVDKHGQFDEIVVELARELQSSREERADSTKRINDNERKNKEIAERIKEYGLTPTRSRIIKYKLWEETDHKCIYCGATIGVKEFLKGFDGEVEHIVPRSVLFDDSFANKACSCRACNLVKGNRLARTFMESKGEEAFNEYVIRINELKNNHKISNTKFTHLMWKDNELPSDFIERQLRESQYISKKAMEMLCTICRTVRATSGSVTDYLRHEWGWDQILHNLNIDRYRLNGLTEFAEIEHRDSTVTKERIIGWSKRLDHRHHAIDALTIACTSQSVIQRLNTLSSLKDVKFKPFIEQSDQHKEKQSQLQQYVQSLPHFTYNEAVEAIKTILVSMKPVSKLTTPGKRFAKKSGRRVVVQTGILVPRGPLHKDKVYGKIKVLDHKVKGTEHEEVVIKYKIEEITNHKDIDSIVDKHIRELVRARFEECGNNAKLAHSAPLYSDKAKTKRIRTVRCFTGLSNTVPVKYDDNNNAIGFADSRNNYYLGLYEDENGRLHEHVATFIHCVERKKFGIPPIINDANEIWDTLLQKKDEYPESFLNQLPNANWKLKFSLQRNEMFVLGMSEEDYQIAICNKDYISLSEYLYRVQKLSSNDYFFARHTESDISQMPSLVNKPGNRFLRIRSTKALTILNPHKVKITNLGEIIEP